MVSKTFGLLIAKYFTFPLPVALLHIRLSGSWWYGQRKSNVGLKSIFPMDHNYKGHICKTDRLPKLQVKMIIILCSMNFKSFIFVKLFHSKENQLAIILHVQYYVHCICMRSTHLEKQFGKQF